MPDLSRFRTSLAGTRCINRRLEASSRTKPVERGINNSHDPRGFLHNMSCVKDIKTMSSLILEQSNTLAINFY
jgi:hypothetical protein